MDNILNFLNSFGLQSIIKLILGFVLAGIIGIERSSWSKPAGFRTHALVGISSVLITVAGSSIFLVSIDKSNKTLTSITPTSITIAPVAYAKKVKL